MIKSCLAFAGAGLAIPVVVFSVFAIDLHFRTQAEIRAVVERRYGAELVQVLARENLDNQICFDIAIRTSGNSPVRRRTVMVQGDLDGGRWWLGREYASMAECKGHFDRG